MFARSKSQDPINRLGAVVLAMLVVLLSFASKSPALHIALHGGEMDNSCAVSCSAEHSEQNLPDEDEDAAYSCAVELFSMGATCPLFFQLETALTKFSEEVSTYEDAAFTTHAYHIQRSRAPPIVTVV